MSDPRARFIIKWPPFGGHSAAMGRRSGRGAPCLVDERAVDEPARMREECEQRGAVHGDALLRLGGGRGLLDLGNGHDTVPFC